MGFPVTTICTLQGTSVTQGNAAISTGNKFAVCHREDFQGLQLYISNYMVIRFLNDKEAYKGITIYLDPFRQWGK